MERHPSELSFERAAVRIRGPRGTVGTGFLVAEDLVCTCAHVVANALGSDPTSSQPPDGLVTVDFPLVDGVSTTAQVVGWVPIEGDNSGDVALLRLTTLPADAEPARLAPDGGGWDEPVRVLGFPRGFEAGDWLDGRLRGRQATGWVQMEISGVEAGFSGGAVWSAEAGGVVGVVVAKQGSRTYMVPLRTALPADVLRSRPCPYRGLEPFREQDAELFHGRARETARLRELMAHRRIVVVTGRSGCGKSSLVRAALWPKLRAEGRTLTELPRVVPDDVELPADGEGVLFVDQFEEIEPLRARKLFERLKNWVAEVPEVPGRPPARQVVLTVRTSAVDEIFTAPDAEMLDSGGVQVLPMGPDDLLATILEPARPRRFEEGLADRIVSDALDAPGQLPLLQFALTRLWDKELTYRDYEAIGGVAGALAEYATSVYQHRLSDQALARRLLVRLVRPTDSSFTLAPARLADLDPELRAMAAELSTHRLVVIDRNVVSLAHEALVHEWPALNEWLVADRDFLAWRDRMRANLEVWRGKPEDRGTLLSGGPLDDAETQAARRPEELSTEEHRYITTSRAAADGRRRRRRFAIASITVLAVVASGLAAVSIHRSDQLADNLYRQAAPLLAAESAQRTGLSSASAVQFAQAAWRHDPGNRQTWGTMLQQVARMGRQESIRVLWTENPVRKASSSGDGNVVAIADTSGRVSVWWGLPHDGPPKDSWQVTTSEKLRGLFLSDDGTTLVVVGERTSVDVWRVADRSGPKRLREPEPKSDATPATGLSARLSRDGGMFVMATDPDHEGLGSGLPSVVEAYDTRSGRRVPTGIAPAREIEVKRVDDKVVWLSEHDKSGGHLRERDIVSGAVLRELPGGSVSPLGVVSDCSTEKKLTITDAVASAQRFSGALPGCGSLGASYDDTGRFVLLGNGSGDDLFQLVTAVDVATGEVFQQQYPYTNDVASEPDGAAIMTRAGDDVWLTIVSGTIVRRSKPFQRKDDATAFAETITSGNVAMTDDGRLLAASRLESKTVALWELPSQRRIGLLDTDLKSLAFTPDGRRLLGAADGEVLVLSVPGLQVERTITPPLPPGIGPPKAVAGWKTTVLPSNDEVVVMHAGAFTRWRLDTGERIGDVMPLARDDPTGLRKAGTASEAIPRKGHPGEFFVSFQEGVGLFDIQQGRMSRRFERAGVKLRSATADSHGNIAVQLSSNELWLWNPDDGSLQSSPEPLTAEMDLIGWTDDGLIIATPTTGSELTFWDRATGRDVLRVDPPGYTAQWLLDGSVLRGVSNDGLIEVDLARDRWMSTLCAINDRDYTAIERKVLERTAGAETDGPPCR
ncbi:trypsin-like peptidase domain-containing protein [Lentzea rhizosphaerae]|uniref:Trypsin-like peptidase domain-containing protein n=1 Tax=Lentzea rhizosphaerae TaxID=2041025 RepID=A0ABV8C5B6_9PSEU